MPEDETITSFADRVIDLAEKVIIQNGGNRTFSRSPGPPDARGGRSRRGPLAPECRVALLQ